MNDIFCQIITLLTTDHYSSFEVTNDHLPTEPPTPPTRTSEALKANLSTVVSQLDTLKQQWTAEKQHLLGEKAVLKDAAKRLNAQIRNAKDEIQNERAKAGSQGVSMFLFQRVTPDLFSTGTR